MASRNVHPAFTPSLPLSSRTASFKAMCTPRSTNAFHTRLTPTSTATSIGLSTTSFRKYHGLGNDFILIDNRHSSTPLFTPSQSTHICDRNRGVGADGVIFLLPPTTSKSICTMRLYNSDGSEPEMCGNGIRCLARFANHIGLTNDHDQLIVDTLAGPIIPQLLPNSNMVRVDMGEPILNMKNIPTNLKCMEQNGYIDEMKVDGKIWNVTAVSMGNPHAVLFVNDKVYKEMDERLESIGPLFENHQMFPARTNTEFVYVRSNTELDMVVWERGAGRTMACGTGACAVLVAAVLTGHCNKNVPVTVHLPGGDLIIEWIEESNHIMMTGPAQLVFEGKLMINN